MWLLTIDGFYSVVQKPWDREKRKLTVRARHPEDLDRLRIHLPNLGPTTEDPAADYRWRAQVAAHELGTLMAQLVTGIDYDNFKNAVKKKLGPPRAALYHRVWDVLRGLQEEQTR